MIFSYIFLNFFTFMNVFCTNETYLGREEAGKFEVIVCENSTTDCYNEQTTDPVPLYVSDSSSEHSTHSDIQTEATAVVTVFTSPFPAHSENKQEDKNLVEKPCSCDTVRGVCNINCCCDIDCSKWERDAFSECIVSKPIPTVGHCISTGIIYKNNTPYSVVKSEDGFFCISKDNFPERNWYIDQGIIRSDRMFERVWRRRKHYHWKMYQPQQLVKFIKKDVYKYGDPVWVYLNSTNAVQQLAYPAPLASLLCGQEKRISYLQNFKSKCLERVPLTEEECLSFGGKYYQGLVIIASPSLINNTHNLEENSDEAFIIVKHELCTENECNIVDSYPVPGFDSMTYNCKNIVKSMNLEVRHNGSNGITEARYRISLTSTLPQEPLFEQTFSVEFLPASLPNISLMFKRSGTPGYRVGLPVITGFLQGVHVVKKNYLTVVSGPNCSESTKILFAENSRTQCILQIPVEATRNCTWLQEEVAKFLSMESNGDMIGASGDPDMWLKRPLSVPEYLRPMATHEHCLIATSLSLDFLYSYSGSLWQPSAKIIGVSSALAGQRFIDCSTSMLFCNLQLVSVISFTDVSQPALSKFATPPVVKIKLPRDFFYPFSSTASNIECKMFVIFIFVCSVIILQTVLIYK